jgi:hypothetical protein
VNGPSDVNRWTSLVLPNTAGAPVTTIPFVGTVPGDGWWYVAVTGITVNRTVNLPAAPTAGEVVVITDEGVNAVAFLSPGNTITVNGNGPFVEGAASFIMTSSYPGEFGSICLQFDGTNWYIFADYAPNASLAGVLTGNVNGPGNANLFLSLLVPAVNADVVIPNTLGWWFVEFTGLTVTHQVLLPAAPDPGEIVVVTDGDGSLAGHVFNVNGNGHNVEGVPIFHMNAAYPGPFGSFALQYDGANWVIFSDYSTVSTPLVLAGNANGPSGANDVIDFGIESTDTAVVAAQFVPISAGRWYVGMKGLTANRGVQLDDAFPPGSRVTIKDEDGSLAAFDIPVTGSTGDTIDGLVTYTLDVASPGPFGSVTIEKNFNGPSEWSVVVQ